MKLHREAFPTLFFATTIFILFALGAWRLLAEYPLLFNIIFLISTVLLALVFFFFRVKVHMPPVSENMVVSPAFGKIVEIETEREDTFFGDERIRVSIFMSPLQIHCNYAPIDGRVIYMEYFPGKYLMAFHPKSSKENEHTLAVIENRKIILGVKQIAGFMARRIVPYIEIGDELSQNDELGFIKFGSRVDVFFPIGTPLLVNVGDTVKGGESVLANL